MRLLLIDNSVWTIPIVHAIGGGQSPLSLWTPVIGLDRADASGAAHPSGARAIGNGAGIILRPPDPATVSPEMGSAPQQAG
jgi:hypothetical protein